MFFERMIMVIRISSTRAGEMAIFIWFRLVMKEKVVKEHSRKEKKVVFTRGHKNIHFNELLNDIFILQCKCLIAILFMTPCMLETATNETKQKDIVKKFRLTTHNLESIKKIANSY